MTRTEAERLAVVETRLSALEKSNESIEAKLDELIAMRNKGIGAFWLASGLMGTGIVGAVTAMWNWLHN